MLWRGSWSAVRCKLNLMRALTSPLPGNLALNGDAILDFVRVRGKLGRVDRS
jgi:anionic cell wall polymer biosynthesis LytR-Cps2A-Psr (LCP) family protein